MDTRAEIQLTDFDTLFSGGSAEMEKALFTCGHGDHKLNIPVVELKVHEIEAFPRHPFKVKDDEDMKMLVENIKEYGVLHPVIVRETNDGRYEMISGHRRKYASELAGIETIPARVMKLTDEEATILMADANFLQRTEIAISEKAKAYRMKFEAIKRQGKRGTGSSYVEIGGITGESKKTIQRLIRISYLTDELMEMIDDKRLGLLQGVNISYLPESDQDIVLWGINETDAKMTVNQSVMIKNLALENKLTMEAMVFILQKNDKTAYKFVMDEYQLKEFFTDSEKPEEIERIILGLLIKWREGKVDV